MGKALVVLIVLGLAASSPAAAQVQVAAATSPAATEAKAGTKPAKPAATVAAAEAKGRPAENKDKAGETEKSEVLAELQQMRQILMEQSRELEAQRAQLRAQQERMADLERKLEQRSGENVQGLSTAPRPATAEELKLLEDQLEAVADTAKAIGEKVTKVETDAATQKRATDGKLRQIGNFTFSGDFRGRFESFNRGTLSTPRYRERFRLRFNVNAKFNDEISGGFTLASGDLNDPISTNQSLTSFYQRKVVAIDKAFLTYTPKWFKPVGNLSITGGKFGYTWYRTELTLDNDLNPEGISPTISWNIKNPVLKNIGVVGYVLPFNEASGATDSYMSGAQFQAGWQLGTRVKVATYLGFMDFHGSDRIRPAQGNTSLAGSTNSNAATATQFASRFGLLDTILRFDVKTPSSRWPLMLQLEYVNNTRACTNLNSISGTRPACNPRDRDGHWIELQLGQTREQNDVNFGYTFIRLEREAVLAAFNFSDLRAPTNILTHRVNFGWQAYRNITIGWTGLFGRQLVTSTSGAKEDILRRMQFDFIYKF